ncbi:MAG: hypothetical protein KatS3mg102_2186 [Planctomycetota bacterium]|nr:MAG: hypothetical protein KatS3mg102_2186 [Planctomycetota bacterium]
MDHPVLVRMVDGARHLFAQLHGAAHRQRSPPQQLIERLPVHQLHREEVLSLHAPDVVDLDDVGVAELLDGIDLAQETAYLLLGGVHAVFQHLERHDAQPLVVARAVDHPHAAARDLLQHLGVAEAPAGQRLVAAPPRPARRLGRGRNSRGRRWRLRIERRAVSAGLLPCGRRLAGRGRQRLGWRRCPGGAATVGPGLRGHCRAQRQQRPAARAPAVLRLGGHRLGPRQQRQAPARRTAYRAPPHLACQLDEGLDIEQPPPDQQLADGHRAPDRREVGLDAQDLPHLIGGHQAAFHRHARQRQVLLGARTRNGLAAARRRRGNR